MQRTDIFKIYGTDYKEMTKALLAATDLLDRIPEGAAVGIKPNLVDPTPAVYGATTHPEVVAGIIEYLQENGVRNLLMLEGSWVGDKTSDAYEYCGYRALTETYGVPFADAQTDGSHSVDCAGLDIRIVDAVDRVDFMINVPVMKGHGQTKMTCALKNMKGLIPNTEKRLFHKMGLHKPLAHLSVGLKQDFIVVDHICGDLISEAGGHPVQTDCVMAGLDPVLMDSYVCRLLGLNPAEVDYIGMAEDLGVGSSDLSQARITVFSYGDGTVGDSKISFPQAGCNPDDISPKEEIGVLAEFAADEDRDPREPWRAAEDQLVDIAQFINDVDACSSCYASIAPALLRIKEEGLLEELKKRLPGKISNGQGYAGKAGAFGVGNCCRGFDRFIPGCPPEEETVYEELKNIALSSLGRDYQF